MTVFDLIDKEIVAKHNSLLAALTTGNVKDYAEYKYICGTINGILGIKEYIESIKEKIEGE
jgi:hypothetical protein